MAASATEVVYAPGACNIAHDEVAYRRRIGIIGLAVTVVVAAVLFIVSAPFWVFLILALPAAISAIGFIQARENFCVRYADEGKYNVEPGYENSARIDDEKAHEADLAKGRRMKIQALTLGICSAVILAAIAVLVG